MAKKLFTVEKIQAIGNKIRSILGVSTLYNIDDMPTAIQNVYNKGKQDGGGGSGSSSTLISTTKTLTSSPQTFNAKTLDNADGYSSITINSGEYVKPTGEETIDLTSSITFPLTKSIAGKSTVKITNSGNYIIPSGSDTLRENKTYDVRSLSQVIVDVPSSGGNMLTGIITNEARATTLTINLSKQVSNLLIYDESIGSYTTRHIIFGFWSSNLANSGGGNCINMHYGTGSFVGTSISVSNLYSVDFTQTTLSVQASSGTANTANAWGITTYRWIAW